MKHQSSTIAGDSQAIFFAAIDILDRDERESFLSQACGNDKTLRAKVDQLLKASSSPSDNALAKLVHQVNPQSPVDFVEDNEDHTVDLHHDPAGRHPVIDRYKILEEIGRGGMGTVYLAQQTEPVKRRVALKVINPGMDSREVIARFEAERQALAMMDHPNIARVFDGGTTVEGRPYFVMELVRGVPITEYCDKHQADLAARLQLFVDVCRAVQHAHQKGIIHRDLKPSNVQITNHDGEPIVKVIDFGVAKALHQELTDRTLYTQFSQLVGTPLYMSPEQADRHGTDLDTRSDIYSLGVLLYELLTGSTPFDREELSQAGVDEARRMICEVEPPRPSVKVSTLKASDDSTLNVGRDIERHKRRSDIRGDLDWIVMKALEKKRDDRYESASALARDLQRHLDHEPIEAKPPTALSRLGKWTRRHKQFAFTSGAALLMALIAVALWFGIRLATVRAIETQVSESATQASKALAEDDLDTANTVLAGAQTVVGKLDNADNPLLARINHLQQVLSRYEEFARLYDKARRNRSYGTGVPENAYKALAIYGLPKDEQWLKKLEDSDLPKEFLSRLADKVYEVLLLAAHHRLLWMYEDESAGVEAKLQRIKDAEHFLELAKATREPTKGYYWILATCSQRRGDLTDGAVREHHDAEALRLRALANEHEPIKASELYFITKDRDWGCASDNARERFRETLSEEGKLNAYREMLLLEPEYYNALFFMARQLWEMERFNESFYAWNGAIAVRPSDATALTYHGECLVRLGNTKAGVHYQARAVEIARELLKKQPERTHSKFYLAWMLAKSSEYLDIAGKPEKAVDALEESVRLLQDAVAAEPTNSKYKETFEEVQDGLSKRKENEGPLAEGYVY